MNGRSPASLRTRRVGVPTPENWAADRPRPDPWVSSRCNDRRHSTYPRRAKNMNRCETQSRLVFAEDADTNNFRIERFLPCIIAIGVPVRQLRRRERYVVIIVDECDAFFGVA